MSPVDSRRIDALYKPSSKVPCVVDVPPLRFLQLTGTGGVGGPGFQDAVGALYGLAYPVKFAAKKALGLSYKVAPLEGLYWNDDPEASHPDDRESLAWRLMIMLPDEVSGELVEATREKVAAKKNPPRLAEVRLQTFSEGTVVQILHIGPYADETPAIDRLFAFAQERGYEVCGDHHEIYLGDPNRADPAKLKTILRYGVRKRRG